MPANIGSTLDDRRTPRVWTKPDLDPPAYLRAAAYRGVDHGKFSVCATRDAALLYVAWEYGQPTALHAAQYFTAMADHFPVLGRFRHRADADAFQQHVSRVHAYQLGRLGRPLTDGCVRVVVRSTRPAG